MKRKIAVSADTANLHLKHHDASSNKHYSNPRHEEGVMNFRNPSSTERGGQNDGSEMREAAPRRDGGTYSKHHQRISRNANCFSSFSNLKTDILDWPYLDDWEMDTMLGKCKNSSVITPEQASREVANNAHWKQQCVAEGPHYHHHSGRHHQYQHYEAYEYPPQYDHDHHQQQNHGRPATTRPSWAHRNGNVNAKRRKRSKDRTACSKSPADCLPEGIWLSNGKFKAQIRFYGRCRYVGSFHSKQDAIQVVTSLSLELQDISYTSDEAEATEQFENARKAALSSEKVAKRPRKNDAPHFISEQSNGKWKAQIWYAGKFRFVGSFDRKQDAIRAVKNLSLVLEDAPARHGLSEVEASVEFESAARKATLIGVEVARNNAPQLISKQPNGQLKAQVLFDGKYRFVGTFQRIEEATVATDCLRLLVKGVEDNYRMSKTQAREEFDNARTVVLESLESARYDSCLQKLGIGTKYSASFEHSLKEFCTEEAKRRLQVMKRVNVRNTLHNTPGD